MASSQTAVKEKNIPDYSPTTENEVGFEIEEFVEHSNCNTEFTIIKNGKVVSSDKIEKAKFREQKFEFHNFWGDMKKVFGGQLEEAKREIFGDD